MSNDGPTPVLHQGFSSPGAEATPWERIVEVLDTSEMFWISTVRADGSPHVCPLPAMWHDGALFFVTAWAEQKGRNLARDPRCALTTGNNDYRTGLDVIVEGSAETVTDRPTLEHLADMWAARLEWPYAVAEGGFRHHTDGRNPNVDHDVLPVFRVQPTKVLSFARGERFAQTRYRP